MAAPLDDITVIEVDNWMASPSAAAILADLGATVIKIEPLSGDPMRGNGRAPKVDAFRDMDCQFDVDNRGKHSICLDLTNPEAGKLIARLCENADIFMCNLLTKRQQKFGLDAETLFKSNPKLVHATLTGYGTDGPDAWRPGFDVTSFFGRSGLYDAMREGPTGTVPMARPAQGDHTTGLAFVGGILAALRLAERTGEGQEIETSLFETAIWTQASDFATTAIDRAPVRQRARENQLTPATNRYPCGDNKWVVFNMPTPNGWPMLCKAIGKEEWLEDERFATPKLRYDAMPTLVQMIDEALSTRTRDEWGEIFDAHGIIWGPVLGLHEVAEDKQAEAIGMFPTLTDPQRGEYRTVNIPMRFKRADVTPRGPSPAIGEHTEQVLTQAGLTADELQRLRKAGVIN
ncbi:MAG: CoA transferase [Pseudomonadales bacterium]|nr:CoA transferase [Pseudomonadales bacterium]